MEKFVTRVNWTIEIFEPTKARPNEVYYYVTHKRRETGGSIVIEYLSPEGTWVEPSGDIKYFETDPEAREFVISHCGPQLSE